MIFAHKIMTEKVKIKASDFFTTSNRAMRGHQFKILKKKTTKLTTVNAFSNRIVNDWNILPSKVVSANTTNGFKNRIDDNWKEEMFLKPS